MTWLEGLGAGIAAVWIFHGLYSKLLKGIPRHERIVARVLGERWAPVVIKLVGVAEVLLGVWFLTGWWRAGAALVQTLALVTMNALEIRHARDLLISPWGMVALNALLVAAGWYWALAPR